MAMEEHLQKITGIVNKKHETMKKFITVLSLFLLFACTNKEKKSIDIIEDFIKNIYLSDNYAFEGINQYMTIEYIEKYNSLSSDDKKIHEKYIKMLVDDIREVLAKNEFSYQIIKENELEKKDYDELIYYGDGEIFRLTSKEDLLFFFIVEKNKIYSFCTDIYLSSKGKVVPYFFFDEQKLIQN